MEIIIGLVVLVMIIWVAMTRNSIVERENGSRRAWADVITYQRRELRALEKMGEAMREYMTFEGDIQTQIAELREGGQRLSESNIDPAQIQQLQARSGRLNAMFNARREAYPQLQSSALFRGYMNEVSENEMQIAASITVFNESVEHFNNTITLFPNNMVNGILCKKKVINTFTDQAAQAEFDYQPSF